MSRRDRKHLPSRAILTASSSHVTRRRPAEAGLAETTAPRRPRGAGGGGGAKAWRAPRRRERKSWNFEEAADAGIDCAAGKDPLRVLVPPSRRTPGWGSLLPLLSPHLAQAFFPLCYRCFSSQVRRGAGPLLGRRLLGSSRPSTPAGPGLLGTLSRPFLLPRAACSLGALSPVTVCGGAVPFLVSTGTERGRGDPFLSPGVRGCGRRGPPETTPGLPAISLERVCRAAREPRAVGWE